MSESGVETGPTEQTAHEQDDGAGHTSHPHLLPLGMSAESGLPEYLLEGTGNAPVRDGDGKLSFDAKTGIVLVLMPRISPDRGAFLIGKYELSQAQWTALGGANNSTFSESTLWKTEWFASNPTSSEIHPAESVSWLECESVLPSRGLRLPTEAEWEFAARGSTNTAWWTGPSLSSLDGRVNLADRHAYDDSSGAWQNYEEALFDGYTMHAPVCALSANPYGLYQILGNVAEWCNAPSITTLEGGSRADDPYAERIVKGGSWHSTAVDLRWCAREAMQAYSRSSDVGVRVAMDW